MRGRAARGEETGSPDRPPHRDRQGIRRGRQLRGLGRPCGPFRLGRRAPAGGTYTFLALAVERAKGVDIIRIAGASAPSGDFVFDNAFSSATLTPPAPFSGSAIFQRNADGTISWAGSLAVSFPGMPDVPLVGPQFETTLGRG
jgi:hypothetical protein